DFTSTMQIISGGKVNLSGTAPGSGDYSGGTVSVGRDGANGSLVVAGTGSALSIVSAGTDFAPRINIGQDGGTGHFVARNNAQISIDMTGETFGGFSVGRGGEGRAVFHSGADLVINGNDGAYAYFRVGRDSGGDGHARVMGAGTTVDIQGTNTEGYATAGFFSIARGSGIYGRVDIIDGAQFTLSQANQATFVAAQNGAVGRLFVEGPGTLLDAGDLLMIGAEGTPAGDTFPDPTQQDENNSLLAERVETDGGDGFVRLAGGATLTADRTFVGENARIDFEGDVTGSVNLFGRMQIGGGEISSVSVSGDFLLDDLGLIEFDIEKSTDRINVGGDATLSLDRGIRIDLLDGIEIVAGTELVLLEAQGSLTVDFGTGSGVVSTNDPDVAFQLGVDGGQLIAVAQTPGAFEPFLVGDGDPNEIIGTAVADLIQGLGGDDTLRGLGGDDTLEGGDGADILDGGAGSDTVLYTNALQRVFLDLQGNTVNNGEAFGDTTIAVENAIGGDRGDVLRGDQVGNRLAGGGANDQLFGRGGNDVLEGDAGNDVLGGGGRGDTLTGGEGADRFVLFAVTDSQANAQRDLVTDFEVGVDSFDLRRIDGDESDGDNDALSFIGGAAFSNTAGEVRVTSVGGNTRVQGDTTGDGSANFEIELTGAIALTGGDFDF
ncbi:MAG: M10 family metallopeptidase C-terminal domain-containing protein, partial [Pseudomonadota bacterium]